MKVKLLRALGAAAAALAAPALLAPVAGAAPPATPPAAIDFSKLRNRDQPSFYPPMGGSAWSALGFDKRLFKVGDSWRIAWSKRRKLSVLKRTIFPYEHARPIWSTPIIVDYRVTKVSKQTLAGYERYTATITAVYAQHVRGELQHGNEMMVDQYLNPLMRCVYTDWSQYGTCRDRDARGVIRSMGGIPLYIGDLEGTPAKPSGPPRLAGPLLALEKRAVRGKSYLHIPVEASRKVYGHTFWAPGNLMPTYVIASDIQGLLIGQRIVK